MKPCHAHCYPFDAVVPKSWTVCWSNGRHYCLWESMPIY